MAKLNSDYMSNRALPPTCLQQAQEEQGMFVPQSENWASSLGQDLRGKGCPGSDVKAFHRKYPTPGFQWVTTAWWAISPQSQEGKVLQRPKHHNYV